MSVRLCVGDAVLVCVNNNDDENVGNDSIENVQIGVIKYIGYIHGYSMSEYVGIELVESYKNGHNGIINGYQYFDCPKGYGLHTKITNIIRKLVASEITIKMQQIITIFKTRLNQYVQALSERDEYIERLKSKQKYLNRLLKESKALQHHLNLHRISNTKNESNTMRTESPSFSSVNIHKYPSHDIKLFNPQKKIRTFPHSITKLQTNNARISNTSQFHSFGLDPITPISLTPRSQSPSPPISKTSVIFHSINNKNAVSRNLSVDAFPDIEPRKSCDSPKQSLFYIDSEYATSTKTEWNDDELHDDQSNISSFDGDNDGGDSDDNNNNNNNMYSSYSTIITSKPSKQNKIKSPPNIQPSMNMYTNTNNMNNEVLKLNKSDSANSSQNMPLNNNNNNNPDIIPYQLPQQQYAYSNITHEQLQKQQNRLPIPSLYIQQQIVTNGYIPTFYQSYSTPLHLHNNPDHNKMSGLYNNSQSKSARQLNDYQIQYVMANNNATYYQQPRIDHWMQQQQGNQLHAQQ